MKHTYLLLPSFRYSLTFSLKELSDKDYQIQYWRYDGKAVFYFHIGHIFDFFEDRTFFDQPPSNQIGYTLYNNEEAELIPPITDGFNEMFKALGFKQSGELYLFLPIGMLL